MDSIKSQLKDMGFDEFKVQRAVESCPEAKTLEQIMEWLISHEDELNADLNKTTSNASTKPQVIDVKESNQPEKTVDDNKETASSMAARKKITVEEAQRIITERQAKRLEEERKKEIEDEKRRRVDGQKMAETRAQLEDQERIRLAQQIRREKLEMEAHRRSVLEQIARDREAMRAKSNRDVAAATSSVSSTSCPVPKPKAPSNECRIALRFPDNSNLIHKFSPQEQLAAVRLFVQQEKGVDGDTSIEFIAPPNKRLSDHEMGDTLESLGLCPASRLEVKFKISHWKEVL